MEVSERDLKLKIKDILKDANLEKITSKLVRRDLEAHFQQSLTNRRAEIDHIIMRTLNGDDSEESEDSSGPEDNGKDNDDDSSSDSNSSLDMTPPPMKRTKKAAARNGPTTSGRSKGKSKNVQLSDEELARQLQASENGMRVRQRVNMSELPWYARRSAGKKRAARENGDEGEKPKKSRGRPCVLKEPLAELLGQDQMTRHEVVKRLWEIAKERQLFDPRDRRFVICDEQFKKVFNRTRLKMFLMTKYLNNAMKEADQVV